MEKLNLKDLINKKNIKQNNNIGCLKKMINVIFLFCLILIVIMLGTVIFSKDVSAKIVVFYVKCLLFVIAVRIFLSMLEKTFERRFKRDINKGNVKVFIEKAKLINKYEKTEYSYFINAERSRLKCYLDFETKDEGYELSVGYDVYRKLKVGEEFFIIRINDKYYGDMIFDVSVYELDSQAMMALDKEIVINI